MHQPDGQEAAAARVPGQRQLPQGDVAGHQPRGDRRADLRRADHAAAVQPLERLAAGLRQAGGHCGIEQAGIDRCVFASMPLRSIRRTATGASDASSRAWWTRWRAHPSPSCSSGARGPRPAPKT